MTTFKFEEVDYEFDSEKCYREDCPIQLPDGRLLVVSRWWFETHPPEPADVRLVPVVHAAKVLTKEERLKEALAWALQELEAHNKDYQYTTFHKDILDRKELLK